MAKVIVLFLFLYTVNCDSSNEYKYHEIANKWSDLRPHIEQYVWPHKSALVDMLRTVASNESLSISSYCKRDLLALSDGIVESKRWAINCKCTEHTIGIKLLSNSRRLMVQNGTWICSWIVFRLG